MSAGRDDFDSPWKEILDPYYPECLAFFFPAIYADIDWMIQLPKDLNREYKQEILL